MKNKTYSVDVDRREEIGTMMIGKIKESLVYGKRGNISVLAGQVHRDIIKELSREELIYVLKNADTIFCTPIIELLENEQSIDRKDLLIMVGGFFSNLISSSMNKILGDNELDTEDVGAKIYEALKKEG